MPFNRDSVNGTWIKIDTLRSLAFGGIGAAYAPIGGPILHNAILISFINETNGNLIISDDGVNDKLVCPANTGKVYDLQTNRSDLGAYATLGYNTQFYIKEETVAPTAGIVYLEVWYLQ